MNENNSSRKILSLVLLIAGVVLLIAALWMDFTKTYLVVNMGSAKLALRGLFLVLGALLVLAGLYYIPTILHHRAIVNFIFLFPLLFTFAVTVIIPMFVGFFFAKYVLKMPLLNNLGSITGGMTSTPALGTLISTAGTEDVASAYAATYPIALIAIVLASKLIISLC